MKRDTEVFFIFYCAYMLGFSLTSFQLARACLFHQVKEKLNSGKEKNKQKRNMDEFFDSSGSDSDSMEGFGAAGPFDHLTDSTLRISSILMDDLFTVSVVLS